MDAATKEEVKEAIVLTVTAFTAVSEEALCNSYRLASAGLAVPVPTLLAELIIEGKLIQRLFRTDNQSVHIFYFPMGSVNAHFLQTEMARRVKYRPVDFDKLGPEEQWAWDKALGLLDWRGAP